MLALRLRQLCSAPVLLKMMLKQKKEAELIKEAIPEERDRKAFFYQKNTTIKLETVVKLVSDIISKDETLPSVEPTNEIQTKVVIVSHWLTVLDVLKQKLGVQAELMSGEILPAKRDEMVALFNEKRSRIKVIMNLSPLIHPC